MLFTDPDEGVDAVAAVTCSARHGPSKSRTSNPSTAIGQLKIFRAIPGRNRHRRGEETSQP